MTLTDLDAWFRSFLDIDGFADADDSLNGIQVGRRDGSIDRVAFGVDACAETMRRAVAGGAQLLFVHHGLFWGPTRRVVGPHLERLRLLIDADLALYACHLPLDAQPEYGNNAVLSRMLGLRSIQGFGDHRGHSIGLRGIVDPPIDLDEAVRRVLPDGTPPRGVIPAGPEQIRSIAVVSGGAPQDIHEAIEDRLDLYVTGEPAHSVHHAAAEGHINFIAAGHYATEVWGVRAVAERLAREIGIQTFFVDVPTGL